MPKKITAAMLAEVFAAASDSRNYFSGGMGDVSVVIDGIYDLEELAEALNKIAEDEE